MDNKKKLKPPTSYGFESNFHGIVMELSWDSKRGSTVKRTGYDVTGIGIQPSKEAKNILYLN